MTYFVQSLKAVFVKDVLIELRSRQVLPTMIVQGLLIVWVLRIAAEAVAQIAVIQSQTYAKGGVLQKTLKPQSNIPCRYWIKTIS